MSHSVHTELLNTFANCADGQRAYLLLDDYFEKLSLARKDFSSHDWWPRVLAARGKQRLEELAAVFLRSKRPLPGELNAHANLERFAEQEQSEREQTAIEAMPGTTQRMPPPTPDLPGMPTRKANSPDPS